MSQERLPSIPLRKAQLREGMHYTGHTIQVDKNVAMRSLSRAKLPQGHLAVKRIVARDNALRLQRIPNKKSLTARWNSLTKLPIHNPFDFVSSPFVSVHMRRCKDKLLFSRLMLRRTQYSKFSGR